MPFVRNLPWLVIALLAGCSCAVDHLRSGDHPDAAVVSDAGPLARDAAVDERTDAAVEPWVPCPSGAWCWVRGRPYRLGADRVGEQVFAFGAEGALVRYAGGSWIAMPVPTRSVIVDAWLRGDDRAYALDEDRTLWRRDGTTFVSMATSVSFSGFIDSFAPSPWALVGNVFSTLDGDVLREIAPPSADIRWISYEIDVDGVLWATGYESGNVRSFYRFDGATWQRIAVPFEGSTSVTDDRGAMRLSVVDSVGRERVYRLDGDTWVEVTLATPTVVPPPCSSYAPYAFSDGRAFTQCLPNRYMMDPSTMRSPIVAYDGTTWSEIPVEADPYGATLPAALWGTVPPALWAGDRTLEAYGSGPTDVFRLRAGPLDSGSTRMGALGDVEHYDGASWTPFLSNVRDFEARSMTDIWFAAEALQHFDGATLTTVMPPEDLLAPRTFYDDAPSTPMRVHALSTTELLVVYHQALLLFDESNGAWRRLFTPLGTGETSAVEYGYIADAHGLSANDLWVYEQAMGSRNGLSIVHHFDGTSWENVREYTLDERYRQDALLTNVHLERLGGELFAQMAGRVERVRLEENDAFPNAAGMSELDVLSQLGDELWITGPGRAARHPAH